MISFEPDHHEEPGNVFQATGRFLLSHMRCAGKSLIIMAEAFRWFVHIPQRRREVGRQMFIIGIKSFLVTATVALFTGMILTLQAGLELRNYSQEANVGVIVAETMLREMGPFMTALILAASVGSAMAAELGTMTVSEEIDALQIMSINPIRYLVMPRIAAMLIMTPVLTAYTDLIGILGGGIVAKAQLDVSWNLYFANAFRFLEMKAATVSLLKAAVFGIIVSTVSCYQGLATTNGAIGVGIATRRSVVISFLLVLIIGYFMTWFFYD